MLILMRLAVHTLLSCVIRHGNLSLWFSEIFQDLGLFTTHLTLEANVVSLMKPIFRCLLRYRQAMVLCRLWPNSLHCDEHRNGMDLWQ